MTLEFQDELIQYLFQRKEAKVYAKYLDESIFDDPMTVEIFKLWKSYVTLYKNVPSRADATELFEIEWNAMTGTKPEKTKKVMLNILANAYNILTIDTEFIEDRIINFAQKKLTRRLFTKSADKIPNGSSKLFDNIAKEMLKIANLKQHAQLNDVNSGHWFIEEPDREVQDTQSRLLPSPFNALNRMTSVGGFHSPQLIVFLKGPKQFGTGVLLRMAAHYLRRGEKVYYADTENGLHDIYTRLAMALLDCEYHELPKYKKQLKRIKAEIAKRGGEFKSDYYEGGKATLDDLDDKLQAYADKGKKFTVCFNDYIDKFKSVDKSIRENRLKTQDTYDHQKRINSKYGFPCFTISPVTSVAFRAAVVTEKDLGEDKYKSYNCTASFALCATDTEIKNGTMRIIPVNQRMGVQFMYNAFTTCALRIDQKRMFVEELNSSVYLEMEDNKDLYSGNSTDTKKPLTFKPRKDLKDE